MTYPGTEAHFEQYTRLPDLHDPIVLGPGSDGIQATAQVYSALAATLDKAVGDLKAVLDRSRHAQQGHAADAARRHVLGIVAAGEVGAEHARLAGYALQEQAAYFARARTDMQAAVDKAAPPPPRAGSGGAVAALGPAQQQVAQAALATAIDGAVRYEGNSNHNLTFVFQSFDPPRTAGPQVSAGPQQPAPDRGGGTSDGGGIGPAPVSSAAVVHPADPPTVGPGSAPSPSGTVAAASAARPPGSLPPTPPPGHAPAGPLARPARPDAVPSSPTPPASRPVPGLPGVPSGERSWPDAAPPGASGPGGSRTAAFPIGNAPDRPGWVPGRPWTGPNRSGPGVGGYRSGDPPGRTPGGPGRSGTGETRSVSGRPSPSGADGPGPARSPATSHQPYLPMGGGGGRGQDSEHRRPPWLVEPDPEALWMSGLPPHGPAVIEPLEE